jgi:seryl-tRNA synthetase
LEKRIRELESANDELLSLIGGRPVDGRMVNPFFLPKLIGEAEERIVKLRKTVAALERGVSEAGWKEEDAKKEYGREMMNVAALQKDVSTLQTNVQGLEKRIELMRQRRSHYAGYFRAHPDPALRVGETIDEMLRRWGEAPLI